MLKSICYINVCYVILLYLCAYKTYYSMIIEMVIYIYKKTDGHLVSGRRIQGPFWEKNLQDACPPCGPCRTQGFKNSFLEKNNLKKSWRYHTWVLPFWHFTACISWDKTSPSQKIPSTLPSWWVWLVRKWLISRNFGSPPIATSFLKGPKWRTTRLAKHDSLRKF